MGDRAQVKLILNTHDVLYFYTHYHGESLPLTVQEALCSAAEHKRLSDSPYFARIIFSHMLLASVYEGDALAVLRKDRGFGISSQSIDGREIVVNATTRTVTLPKYWGSEGGSYSFNEYMSMNREDFPPFVGL